MKEQINDKKITFRVSNQEREQYKKILKYRGTNIQNELNNIVKQTIEIYWGGYRKWQLGNNFKRGLKTT